MSGNIDRYGRARTPQNLIPRVPTRHSPSYYTRTTASYNPGFWERINDFFESIGDWFEDILDGAIDFFYEKLIPVLAVLAIIGAVIGGIVIWINEGFWEFVLYVILIAIFGAIIAYAATAALVVLGFIVYWILKILRYIFYNAITFFITVVVVVGIVIGVANSAPAQNTKPQTTTTTAAYTTYYCNASSLNVRSYASTNAPIIGKLRRGDTIKVYSINNGFAKIEYKGKTGYVSERYITPY